MLLRPLRDDERFLYNQVVTHPLQSWEWGEFRKATNVTVERVGLFDQQKLVKAFQITFHPIPFVGMTVGYCPRGLMPDEEQLGALKQLGKQHNALFIKLEPNVAEKVGNPSAHHTVAQFLQEHDAVPGRPLFTRFSFQLDLTKSEEEIFEKVSSKTRYNINLAAKKGVVIKENTSEAGMEQYISILQETTQRQGFFAHTPDYFRKLWQNLSGTNVIRIFEAWYEDTVLVSWVMFVFNGVLYYPYGSSRAIHRDVMASNLMMWEMIRFGKSQGCTMFDMWGSLGPEPDPKDPWFGFHRFKKGYGGDLVEFVGTYDLVIDNRFYQAFRVLEDWRWKLLKAKAAILQLLPRKA